MIKLEEIGWKNVSTETVINLNKTMDEYNIHTEEVEMFITQITIETDYNKSLVEYGSDNYLSNKDYGIMYSGSGYIQLTWDYGYQAFATYMILEAYPDLKKFIDYLNPNHNNGASILATYKEIINLSKQKGYDISEFTDIVNIGRDYVANNFAWDVAGYYWEIGGINDIINNGGTINDVTAAVNKWAPNYDERSDLYYEVVDIIK